MRKLGGFAATTAVHGVVSTTAIFFVIHSTGEAGWGSVAVGQSVGSVLAVFTLLGWAQTGPIDVVRATPEERGILYLTSLLIRLCALALMAGVAVLLVVPLETAHPLATTISAFAMLLIGVGGSWFYVGELRPARLMVFDTVPRALGIASGAALVFGTRVIELFSVCTLLGAASAVALTSIDVLRRCSVPANYRLRWADVRAAVYRQRHGIVNAALTSTYISAPVIFVQVIAPGAVPVFALADRLKQQALTLYRPVIQVLQGWTPRGAHTEFHERVRWAAALALLAAIAIFVAATPMLVLISHFISAGTIGISWSVAVPVALALAMGTASATLSLACLVPLGLEKVMARSALLGVIGTAGAIWPLTAAFAAVGAAWAVAAGQLTVALFQALKLRQNLVGKAAFSTRWR